MEVNEMKGVHNLPFDENPFDHNLHNPSLVEIKSHQPMIQTKMMMMIKRQDGDQNQPYELEDHHSSQLLHANQSGSCRFNRAIFPTNNNNSSSSQLMNINQAPTNVVVFSPNTSCYSNDTVLDGVETLDHRHSSSPQLNVMAERKLRRMISNRESARRSRMRKKKQIEELQYQVSQLEGSNRQLSDKLLQLLECNQQILHENAELKHKVSSLQIILTDFLTPLRNLEDVFCSSNRLRTEASNSSHHLAS